MEILQKVGQLFLIANYKLDFDVKTRCFQVKIPTGGEVQFSGQIIDILGLEAIYTKSSDIFLEKNDINMSQNVLVKTDIITEQYYGDQLTKLLKILAFDHKRDVEIIKNPHYIKLNQSRVNTIDICLETEQGGPIQFSSATGQILTKLHFRKAK